LAISWIKDRVRPDGTGLSSRFKTCNPGMIMASDSSQSSDVTDRPARWGFGIIVAWGCWLGLVSGSLEIVIFLIKCRVLDPRNLNVSRQMVWMFPVSGLIVVGSAGIILALISRFVAKLATPRLVLFALGTVALTSVCFRAPIYTAVCLFLSAGLAWKGSNALARGSGRSIGWLLVGGLALLGLTMAASLGREMVPVLGRSGSTGPGWVRPDGRRVILIVLDTVRADHLSLNGYSRDTTPNLKKLANRGVRFDRAFSTAPWTAPSHAGMFTGRWPGELSIGWDHPLDETHATLAEVLGRAGYDSVGIVANTTYCSSETGLDRGFAHYEDYDVTLRGILLCSSLVERSLNFVHKHPELAARLGLEDSRTGDRKDASRINRDFLRWVDRRVDPARPYFAFLNYYDVHHPYLAPDLDAGKPFGSKPESPRDFRLLKTWWERDKRGIKPEDLELARDSYDRCIAYLDDQLGKLFDELRRRGELDRSVVIITSDHGEHLGERDLFGHGCSVYREELHVPLLIVAPGLVPEAKSIVRPVSLRDLPATVLDLIGMAKISPFPGQSLAKTWSGDRETSTPVISELQSPPEDDPNRGRSPGARGPMLSVVDADFHYIRAGDGREELFHPATDPEEQRNLVGQADRKEVLERFRSSFPR